MRRTLRLLMLSLSLPSLAAAADNSISVELNAAESAEGRCRLSFVIANKRETAIDSMKFDLAVFGRDGVIYRRLATEMGPVRGLKTIVRTFAVDGDCGQIGSILLNDVTACTPGDAGACLDRLVLNSRVPNVRLFK